MTGKTLKYMIACGVKDSAMHVFYVRNAFMRLYRKNNIYGDYRKSQDT